jgi:hypothetical protein
MEIKGGEKKRKGANNYVNNKDFLAAMVVFRDSVIEAKEKGTEKPPVPKYVAECIILISTNLSYKPNFINYKFRDEMVADGIENCIQYINNFNPDISSNPFAYFTQIIYFAFLRRIEKEKKYLYTKYKASEYANLNCETDDRQDHDQEADYNDKIQYSDWGEEFKSNFIKNFEEKKRLKNKRKVPNLSASAGE